ncbi:MAG: cation:dicarboxylase symporter family transporter, partial [Bacteroidales bacterium]|nr:cation:dicarboxylase symporter family transporter [Bacteroidales bacterium]
MGFWKNYRSTLLLLGGVVIGGIAGAIAGEGASVVKPVGDIFLNLIFVLVVPLVFFSIAQAICSLK